MVFRWMLKNGQEPNEPQSGIPTVKFDPERVTLAIRADVWDRIQEFEDLPIGEEEAIFEVAVHSIARGRDMALLARALKDFGVPKDRAVYITRYLHNRATALMNVAQMLDKGLTEGIWLYAGASCYANHPATEADLAMDAAHKSLDKRRFLLDRGVKLHGGSTFPGLEPGCKCIAIAVVPGFEC